jgi:hypothetical protein
MIFGASAGRASQLQLYSSAVWITTTSEPDLYLIADYSKILLFDKHHGIITPMAIVGATRRNVPTGLAYDSQRNRLFIAMRSTAPPPPSSRRQQFRREMEQ